MHISLNELHIWYSFTPNYIFFLFPPKFVTLSSVKHHLPITYLQFFVFFFSFFFLKKVYLNTLHALQPLPLSIQYKLHTLIKLHSSLKKFQFAIIYVHFTEFHSLTSLQVVTDTSISKYHQ